MDVRTGYDERVDLAMKYLIWLIVAVSILIVFVYVSRIILAYPVGKPFRIALSFALGAGIGLLPIPLVRR